MHKSKMSNILSMLQKHKQTDLEVYKTLVKICKAWMIRKANETKLSKYWNKKLNT